MEMYMMVTGWMGLWKAKVSCVRQTERNTREVSVLVSSTDLESRKIRMAIVLKANSMKERGSFVKNVKIEDN
jgi:hypothetical protein